jgi:hypothetical protein
LIVPGCKKAFRKNEITKKEFEKLDKEIESEHPPRVFISALKKKMMV